MRNVRSAGYILTSTLPTRSKSPLKTLARPSSHLNRKAEDYKGFISRGPRLVSPKLIPNLGFTIDNIRHNIVILLRAGRLYLAYLQSLPVNI